MEQTDRQLVAAANRGEAEAFEMLYERHRDWAYRVACSFCADAVEAQDIVQEVFLAWFDRFPGFVLHGRVTTWLYPLVRGKAVDHVRRHSRMVELKADGQEPAEGELRSPEAQRRELAALVAGLEHELRELIILRYVDGYRLHELADLLGLAEGTVKSRLHRALRHLRRMQG